MPSTNIETPDWRRDMAAILKNSMKGVVVVDDQLRVIFANEALTLMGHFERNHLR
jgi:PAS domain-containing protein